MIRIWCNITNLECFVSLHLSLVFALLWGSVYRIKWLFRSAGGAGVEWNGLTVPGWACRRRFRSNACRLSVVAFSRGQNAVFGLPSKALFGFFLNRNLQTQFGWWVVHGVHVGGQSINTTKVDESTEAWPRGLQLQSQPFRCNTFCKICAADSFSNFDVKG